VPTGRRANGQDRRSRGGVPGFYKYRLAERARARRAPERDRPPGRLGRAARPNGTSPATNSSKGQVEARGCRATAEPPLTWMDCTVPFRGGQGRAVALDAGCPNPRGGRRTFEMEPECSARQSSRRGGDANGSSWQFTALERRPLGLPPGRPPIHDIRASLPFNPGNERSTPFADRDGPTARGRPLER